MSVGRVRPPIGFTWESRSDFRFLPERVY